MAKLPEDSRPNKNADDTKPQKENEDRDDSNKDVKDFRQNKDGKDTEERKRNEDSVHDKTGVKDSRVNEDAHEGFVSSNDGIAALMDNLKLTADGPAEDIGFYAYEGLVGNNDGIGELMDHLKLAADGPAEDIVDVQGMPELIGFYSHRDNLSARRLIPGVFEIAKLIGDVIEENNLIMCGVTQDGDSVMVTIPEVFRDHVLLKDGAFVIIEIASFEDGVKEYILNRIIENPIIRAHYMNRGEWPDHDQFRVDSN